MVKAMASVTQAGLSDSCFRGGREGAEVALDGPGGFLFDDVGVDPCAGHDTLGRPGAPRRGHQVETLLAAYTPRIQAG